MNLILHLFKTDVRRMRLLLIVWMILILGQFSMSGLELAATTGNIGWQLILAYLQHLVPYLQWLALLVMVPLVIQEEPLTGTTAFWFTRPISGRMLLKEKSLFIGVFFVMAPLLTEALVLAVNGITLHDILLAVPEIVLKQLFVIFIVALAAVITPNFAKFIQVAVVGYIIQMLLEYVLSIVRTLGKDVLQSYRVEEELQDSRLLVTALLTILFGGFLISRQYLSRRTRKTVLAALPCTLVVLGAHYFWPWNFTALKQEAVQMSVLNTDTISLSFNNDSIYVYDESRWNPKDEPRKDIWGNIEVDGAEAQDLIKPIKVNAVLAFPDGKSLSYDSSDDGSYFTSYGGRGGEAIQSTLSPVELVNKKNRDTATLFGIEDKLYQQYVNTPGAYTGKVTLGLSRYQVEGELPLKRGSRFKQGSEYVVITDVLYEPKGISVLLRDQTVNLLFDPNRHASNEFSLSSQKDVIYVLRNKKLGQAFLPKDDRDFTMVDNLEKDQRLRTHSLRRQYTSLSALYDENETLPEITEEWLKDATLVRLRLVEMGTFTKPLVIKNFWLASKNEWLKSPNDPNLEVKLREARALINLANVYSDTARYAKAEPLYNNATTLQEKYNGPESQELASALMYHAIMCQKEKKDAKALALNERILAIKEENSYIHEPEWSVLFKDLADLAVKNRNITKAEFYFKRGIEVCKKKYGEKDARTTKLTESLQDFYLKHPKR